MILFPLRFIVILPFHPRLGLLKGLFSVGLSVNIFKVLLSSSILTTYPAHLNLLDLTIKNCCSEIQRIENRLKSKMGFLRRSLGMLRQEKPRDEVIKERASFLNANNITTHIEENSRASGYIYKYLHGF